MSEYATRQGDDGRCEIVDMESGDVVGVTNDTEWAQRICAMLRRNGEIKPEDAARLRFKAIDGGRND